MRKYAYLKAPHKDSSGLSICKIMLYAADEGFYLFGYPGPDDVLCSSDSLYDTLEDLYADWNDLIDDKGWIDMEDPLPGCQHDAFIPLRVRGRDAGRPEWGRYETLKDGKWIPYDLCEEELTE